MKEETRQIIGGIIIVICLPFLLYGLVAFVGWMLTDPFSLIPDKDEAKCEYQTPNKLGCATKEEYCRSGVREMFLDLNDTMGSSTNNQDQMSKAMLEVYNKCLEAE